MSGIIGANGNVVGSAPDVSFGVPPTIRVAASLLVLAIAALLQNSHVRHRTGALPMKLLLVVYATAVREHCLLCAGAYRVFSCDGTTGANTILIAAAEQAYEDGMDIINLCVLEQFSCTKGSADLCTPPVDVEPSSECCSASHRALFIPSDLWWSI